MLCKFSFQRSWEVDGSSLEKYIYYGDCIPTLLSINDRGTVFICVCVCGGGGTYPCFPVCVNVCVHMFFFLIEEPMTPSKKGCYGNGSL